MKFFIVGENLTNVLDSQFSIIEVVLTLTLRISGFNGVHSKIATRLQSNVGSSITYLSLTLALIQATAPCLSRKTSFSQFVLSLSVCAILVKPNMLSWSATDARTTSGLTCAALILNEAMRFTAFVEISAFDTAVQSEAFFC